MYSVIFQIDLHNDYAFSLSCEIIGIFELEKKLVNISSIVRVFSTCTILNLEKEPGSISYMVRVSIINTISVESLI